MVEFLGLETLGAFLGVILIDLILSGDNAVVIALAVRRLGGPVRRRAILLGIAGAVGLRIVFVAIISLLLGVPFLQLVGGLLLVYISWQLVQEEPEDKDVKAASGLWSAIWIITLADAVMSLDNVIALVAVSGGNVWLVAIGIALSIPLVIFGSAVLSYLMNRFPILIYLGAGLLVYVAVEMIFQEPVIEGFSRALEGLHTIIEITLTLAFLAVAYLYSRRRASTPAVK